MLNNIIYKITCLFCSQCYIGQTSTELHLRINVHRNLVKKSGHASNEIMHFKKTFIR